MYILFIILSFQLLIDSRVFFFISELIKFIQQITHLFYHYDIVRTDNPHTKKKCLGFLKSEFNYKESCVLENYNYEKSCSLSLK